MRWPIASGAGKRRHGGVQIYGGNDMVPGGKVMARGEVFVEGLQRVGWHVEVATFNKAAAATRGARQEDARGVRGVVACSGRDRDVCGACCGVSDGGDACGTSMAADDGRGHGSATIGAFLVFFHNIVKKL